MVELQEYKNNQIKAILDIILSFWKEYIKPEIIILFWDYIKNDKEFINVVREWDQVVKYFEILNIFIITKSPAQEKNISFIRDVNSKIKNSKDINVSVNIMIEDIYSFNEWIKELRYFYLDIIQSWIIVYDSKKCVLRKQKDISKNDIKSIQKEDFESWFQIWCEFFIDYKNAFMRWSFKIAIFYLHQSVESFMTCYLLVKDWYKPKTHNLEIIYSNLKNHSNKFNKFFDLTKENYYFYLLNNAYSNSRYKKNFKVEKEELIFLENKTLFLKELVKKLCLNELTK